jgi:hypothetical protein
MFEPRGFGAGSFIAGASDEASPEWIFEPRGFGAGSFIAGASDEASPE